MNMVGGNIDGHQPPSWTSKFGKHWAWKELVCSQTSTSLNCLPLACCIHVFQTISYDIMYSYSYIKIYQKYVVIGETCWSVSNANAKNIGECRFICWEPSRSGSLPPYSLVAWHWPDDASHPGPPRRAMFGSGQDLEVVIELKAITYTYSIQM